MVAGDVVYNDVHMWMAGSTPESRDNWRRVLDVATSLEAFTVIAGHRHPAASDNDAMRQVEQSRRYLDDFEDALTTSSSPQELIATVTDQYPHLGSPYTLWVRAFDLLPGS